MTDPSLGPDRWGQTAVRVPAPGLKLSALQKLTASRERIGAELDAIAHPPATPALFSGPGRWEDRLRAIVQTVPGAEFALNAVQSWWADHPTRQAVAVAGKAALPLLRQRPAKVLGISVLAGATFMLLRPWRLLRPALMLNVLTQIAVHRVTGPRKESWLRLLSTLAGRVR